MTTPFEDGSSVSSQVASPAIVPLSARQREMFIEQTIHDDVPLHNIGGYFRINGPFDHFTLEQAIHEVIARNDALRLVLRRASDGGMPSQEILQHVDFSLAVEHFDLEEKAKTWVNRFVRDRFDLFDRPLYRFVLVVISQTHSALVIVFHHMLGDGIAIMLTMQRVADFYNSSSAEERAATACPTVGSLIEAERGYLGSPAAERDGHYWAERYLPPPPQLFRRLADSPRRSDIEAHVVEIDLPRGCYRALCDEALRAGGNGFQALLVALYGYFGRRQGAEDLMIGVSLANRKTETGRAAIGFTASVAPVRLSGGFEQTFATALHAVTAELRRAYRHHRLPLGVAAARVGLHQSGRARLFDIAVTYLSSPFESARLGSAEVEIAYQLFSGFEAKPLQVSFNCMDPKRPGRISLICNKAFFTATAADGVAREFCSYIEFLARG